MDPKFPFDVLRPWGSFRQFTGGEASTVKLITVESNASLSLQSHTKRDEFERVIEGSGKLQVGEEIFEVRKGDEHFIPKGVKHRIMAGESGITLLEISFGEFDEGDITRFEDKYGRA